MKRIIKCQNFSKYGDQNYAKQNKGPTLWILENRRSKLSKTKQRGQKLFI
jgi:hypothetical protein